MKEVDLPLPENADANTLDRETGHSGQGLPAPLKSAAHLNSAKASPPLAGDILHGAHAIAEFLYGDRKFRRKVYHLVECGLIPFFKLGSNVCARKSVLLEWIGEQERHQRSVRIADPDLAAHSANPPALHGFHAD